MSKPNFQIFSDLHQHGLLRLPNAWDAGSARLTESLGAQAVATTSAGVAWANGYGDGHQMPTDVVVSVCRSMARVIKVPLSADIEGGYSASPEAVAQLGQQLADVGVVGINLEDGREPAELLARKIEAVKNALARQGLDLFINARTDVYLDALVDAPQRVAEVLQRARLYAAAGANGLFVPAIVALPEIRAISSQTALPLNVLAWNGLPGVDDLQQAGVRRLSAGSGIASRLWAQTQAMTHSFLAQGELTGAAKPYAEIQQLLA